MTTLITYSNSYRGTPDTVSGRMVAKLYHRDGFYNHPAGYVPDNFCELKYKKLIKVVYTQYVIIGIRVKWLGIRVK